MPRRQRDYAREYRARIARGQALGLTRKQARGHGGDRPKRASAPPQPQASPQYTREGLTSSYLARLGDNRRAKIEVTFADGTRAVIGGGKGGQQASGLRDYLADLIEEHGSLSAAAEALGYGSRGGVMTFQVIWI